MKDKKKANWKFTHLTEKRFPFIMRMKKGLYAFLAWFRAFRQTFFFQILFDRHGTVNLPEHEVEALARCFLPDILAFFATDDGKASFEKWKAEKENRKPKQTIGETT